MTTPARVRRATLADIPALAGFASELYRLHHRLDPVRFWDLGSDAPGRREGRERFFASQLDEPGTRLLVATHEGRVVGYAYLTHERNDYENLLEHSAWLHDVHVEPEVRATGLADELFAAARAEAIGWGAPLLAFTVAATNARAAAFFARHGARVTMREMVVELPPAP